MVKCWHEADSDNLVSEKPLPELALNAVPSFRAWYHEVTRPVVT